ncbi:MAG TPA: DNA polymerase III subunit beta [Patescibacteria group bacterium]
MNFSVTQENLVKGLQVVNRIATTRATLPVLGNILLTTDKGRLKLVSTDLELAIDTYIGAKVEIEGAITVPARTFTDFVTNNSDTTIDFSLNDTVLNAKSAHYTAEIKGIDATEFPTIPEIGGTNVIHLAAPLFKEAIQQTVFATTQDETRPVLSGVALFISGKELKLVATDSYRLAEKRIPIEEGEANDVTVIVPARALLELSRLIHDDVARVSLSIDQHQMMAVCGESHLVSRLIEGTFPAYEAIIPKELATTVTLNRSEFISSLKMASLFSRDSAYNVTFTVGERDITLKALSAQIGASTSTVTAAVSGPAVSIAFNARFVLEVLQVMSCDAIQFQLQQPHDNQWYPGIVKSTQDQNYQYVIMPLRTEV